MIISGIITFHRTGENIQKFGEKLNFTYEKLTILNLGTRFRAK